MIDRSFRRGIGRRQHRVPGISLPEVLIIVGILVLLLALLVPGINSARERARRVLCANNLRQWGTALQYYRDDYNDYLPREGTYLRDGIQAAGTWFNELPPYLELPPYKDLEGANEFIRELPNIHVWICPSKNLTDAFKSGSGKNQFHYGMNQVLDGIGSPPDGSRDAPGYPDTGNPVLASIFRLKPYSVFMFDISPNSPAGSPRSVATMYQRDFDGGRVAKFHGDYANVLYLSGAVTNVTTDDLVEDRDFRRGKIIWDHPQLYWGYPPPHWPQGIQP